MDHRLVGNIRQDQIAASHAANEDASNEHRAERAAELATDTKHWPESESRFQPPC